MHSLARQGLLANRQAVPGRSGSVALVALLLAGVMSAANAGSGAKLVAQALGTAAEQVIANQLTAPQNGHASGQMRQALSGGSSQAGRDEYGYVVVPAPLAAASGTVIVAQSAGRTLVSEGEVTDTYSIVLSEAPTSDVSIAVGAGVPSAGIHQLLFTTALCRPSPNASFTALTVTDCGVAMWLSLRRWLQHRAQ